LAEIAAPRVKGESDNESSLRRICLLQSFLAEAHNAVHRAERDDGQSEWLKRAYALLDADLRDYPDWEALAGRLDLSYDRFRKRFHELTGQAPSQYRAQRRITWASELLKERRRPLADIAIACGYHDVFHFAKRFQQATGLTPAQFRQRHPG
jgi:transcriptional regulator GlxA family with amidase domain